VLSNSLSQLCSGRRGIPLAGLVAFGNRKRNCTVVLLELPVEQTKDVELLMVQGRTFHRSLF
jgi:hypothetical protein